MVDKRFPSRTFDARNRMGIKVQDPLSCQCIRRGSDTAGIGSASNSPSIHASSSLVAVVQSCSARAGAMPEFGLPQSFPALPVSATCSPSIPSVAFRTGSGVVRVDFVDSAERCEAGRQAGSGDRTGNRRPFFTARIGGGCRRLRINRLRSRRPGARELRTSLPVIRPSFGCVDNGRNFVERIDHGTDGKPPVSGPKKLRRTVTGFPPPALPAVEAV